MYAIACPKMMEIGILLFTPPDTKYVDPDAYGSPFTENIGPSVKRNF